MHIHILGICGTFMGGIALIARQAGFTVTGCDANVYPPMSTQLTEQGIALIEGYSPDQLAMSARPVSWSATLYPVATRCLKPSLIAACPTPLARNGWPTTCYAASGYWRLPAHTGKTTTSSLLTWMLEDAGLNPGFLIGGVPGNFGISARLTDTPFFVVEADEYDTAFCDKRSKFVHYRPRTVILNNLEYDHADIFPDLGAIETQFHHLVRTVPRHGRIIANGTEESLTRVIDKGCWSELEWFGGESDWQVEDIDERDKVAFMLNKREVARCEIPMAGKTQSPQRPGSDGRSPSRRRHTASCRRRTLAIRRRQAPTGTAWHCARGHRL